jgi:spore germination cell wall hydrolase CwlJ-like protein
MRGPTSLRLFVVTVLSIATFGVVFNGSPQGAIRNLSLPAAVLSGAVTAPMPARLFMPSNAGLHLDEEFRCLALNVYWEARSEKWTGQVGVAMVTLNRGATPIFPKTICGVVRQGGPKPLHRCQFSWYCDGKSDIPRNAKAWRRAQEVAYAVLFGGPRDPTHGALFYHADYVNPTWSRYMTQTTQIGRHIYYHYTSS